MISLISGVIFLSTSFTIYLKYKYNFTWLKPFWLTILIDIISVFSLLVLGLSLNSDIIAFILSLLLILIASQKHFVLNVLLAIPTALLFTNQPIIHFSNVLTIIYCIGTLFYGIIAIGHDLNKYNKKIKSNKKYNNKISNYWHTCQFFKLFSIFIKNHFSSYKHHIL